MPTQFIDPMGRETDYQINSANGEIMSMTQVDAANTALNRTTSYTCTPAPTQPGDPPGGLVATETDQRGIETSYSYTSHGLLAAVTEAVGATDQATISYGYTNDELTSETNELGQTTTFKVDALGRTIETDSPPPDAAQSGVYPVTKDSYDALGRLQSESVAQSVSNGTTVFSVTDYAYKATGGIDAPVTQEIEAAGSPQAVTLNFSYDDADNLLSEADELGRVTAFDYDADNDQIAEQDPSPNVAVPTDPNGGGNNQSFNRQTANGPVTSANYGPAGNVIAQVDAAGNETDNTYDLMGDLLSTAGPAPTSGAARPTMTYSYDHDGELASETDPLGGVTTFEYNSFGELIERQGPSPDGIKPGPITRYQYDGDGNLVASFDANGNETQYVYNDRNERIEEIDPAPGGTISYSYNAAQQLVQVVDAVGHVTQYQYGPDGNRTATIAPNLTTGLAGDGQSHEDTQTFERARKSVQQRSDCTIIERERSRNRRRNRVHGNDARELDAAGAEIAWSARGKAALPVGRRTGSSAVNQKRAG